MTSITKFLEASSLIKQLQDKTANIVEEYGPDAIRSETFESILVSFVSTVVISYAISSIADNTKASTSLEVQEIMNNIIKEISPDAKGIIVKVSDPDTTDALMEMYTKASANRLPC